MTPFDKVKNQLITKIKETYVPDQSQIGGVINKLNKLDFTGGDDNKGRKDDEDDDDDDDG